MKRGNGERKGLGGRIKINSLVRENNCRSFCNQGKSSQVQYVMGEQRWHGQSCCTHYYSAVLSHLSGDGINRDNREAGLSAAIDLLGKRLLHATEGRVVGSPLGVLQG